MTHRPPEPTASRPPIHLAVALLVVTALWFYRNSFSVPFVYDDVPAIAGNPSLHSLWPLSGPLAPPPHLTTSGRPLVNLSLALNYALSGTEVWSYHALNLAIHVGAALALFGLVRRTIESRRLPSDPTPLALVIAALWMLHPLQTESVTYVVQRAEALVGLFYLLTLYAFARSTDCHPLDDNGRDRDCHLMDDNRWARRGWQAAAVVACAAGMACKEVMVSAPLAVLLYDRTFVAGSFREAWRRRRGFHVALATSWALLAFLVLTTGGTRDGSAGFGQGMSSWTYALTQARAIALYLRLALWPGALVFDYGNATAGSLVEVLPSLALVLALGGATVVALRRWPAAGFLGFVFFAVLAPSSSIVPVVTETIAEHRMYLPLAALVTALVLGAHARFGRAALPVAAAAALALGFCTTQRNTVYRDHVSLWTDTVEKAPANHRARGHLGSALVAAGRDAEALRHFETAAQLAPRNAKAHFNLATALARAGQPGAAHQHFETALALEPAHADAHNNHGDLLLRLGRRDEALQHFEAALRADPGFAPAHNNLGIALGSAGQLDAAIAHFISALRERPDYAEARNNLGFALKCQGRIAEAIPHFAAAVKLNPRYAEAHNNLALGLAATNRSAESIYHFREVTRLEPGYADARYHLGHALLRQGAAAEARAEFEAALRLAPNHAAARRELLALHP